MNQEYQSYVAQREKKDLEAAQTKLDMDQIKKIKQSFFNIYIIGNI